MSKESFPTLVEQYTILNITKKCHNNNSKYRIQDIKQRIVRKHYSWCCVLVDKEINMGDTGYQSCWICC